MLSRRFLAASIAAASAFAVAGAIAVPSAQATADAPRVVGYGARNGEYLSADVKLGSDGTANGVIAWGFLDGGSTCTETHFTNAQVVSPGVVSFDARGFCTETRTGFARVSGHHRIVISDGSPDSIDINAYSDSGDGITIPGGTVTGNFTFH